jgi:adenylate cyclase
LDAHPHLKKAFIPIPRGGAADASLGDAGVDSPRAQPAFIGAKSESAQPRISKQKDANPAPDRRNGKKRLSAARWQEIGTLTITALVLFFLCSVWALLSQLSMLRLPGGYERFLGPDGALAFLETRTVDWRIRARGELPAPLKLWYVDVDSLAIGTLGNFPWNREFFAMALHPLFEHGRIKAAGMDFVFSNAGIPALGREEAERGSKALGKVVHKHRNIVLAATYGSQNRPLGDVSSFPFVFEKGYGTKPVGPPELPGFPVVGPTWGHIGLIDTVGEDVRYLPFFAETKNHTYFPMSLKLALLHWGLDESAVERLDGAVVVRGQDGEEKTRIPLRMGQLAEPNWFSAWMGKYMRHSSIVEVMAQGQAMAEGDEQQKAAAGEFFKEFQDAVVLIGPVDPLLKDSSVMPLSGPQPVPRVSVHGNLLQTIVSGRFVHRLPVWVNTLLIFGMGFVAASFCFVPQRFSTVAKVAGAVAALAFAAGAFYVFANYDLVVPMVAPLGAAVTCTFAGVIIQLAREGRQKKRITGMFGTYLSPALVEKMVESGDEPQLGGIDAEVTAFFSDVQGFSGFSELLTPQQLVGLMNEYLSAMTDILMENGCYVDKYIGDAIVGIFNAPAPLEHHALKACVATQLLQKRLGELREKWRSEGDKWPPFVGRMQMRIGCNTGSATVGNMGSSRRFNYTMMGDTVNLAARCESGAKSFGVYTMITGETKRAAEAGGDACVFRFLDKIIVKGRTEPAEMYEVVCLREDLDTETRECLALHAEGIKFYLGQKWDEAIVWFEKAAALEPNRPERNPDPPTTPSLVMLERCLALKANPPGADWNGVYKMTSK